MKTLKKAKRKRKREQILFNTQNKHNKHNKHTEKKRNEHQDMNINRECHQKYKHDTKQSLRDTQKVGERLINNAYKTI